jgi:carbonic anhydrase
VGLATAISVFAGLDVARVKLPDGGLLGGIGLPGFPTHAIFGAIAAVLTVAVVASAESLLSAVATDKMHSGPRANLDRELIGQGVANSLAGLLGGLPITGVIVRSTANIESGARTRLSAILHGVWVVLFVSLLGAVIRQVPLAVLAGLLVVVGMRLVNIGHIRELIKHREGVVYFATLFGVISTNLLAGIGIGIGVAILRLLFRMTRLRVRTDKQPEAWHVHVEGALTFLGVPRLNAALSALPSGERIKVALHVDVMDHAAYDALHSFRASYERCGGTVDIAQPGVRPRAPLEVRESSQLEMVMSSPRLPPVLQSSDQRASA